MISDFIWRDSHGLLCSPRKLIWDLADRVADIQLGEYILYVLFYYSGYLQKSNSMAKNMDIPEQTQKIMQKTLIFSD